MTEPSRTPEDGDWSSGTFQGAEREQLRVWSRLPLRRKLEALEEMCDHARRTIRSRQRQGLPYVDPITGEVIGPPRASMVREDGRALSSNPSAGSLTYFRGDATQPGARPAVIVHVCNDVGAWGAGFVMAISKRWPKPEHEYRAAFAGSRKPQLGDVQLVEVETDLWVANMVAQHGIRRSSKGVPPIRHGALRDCLTKVAAFAREHRASVHMPRIACGLAGGKWEEVEPLIRDALLATGLTVTVYDFP